MQGGVGVGVGEGKRGKEMEEGVHLDRAREAKCY